MLRPDPAQPDRWSHPWSKIAQLQASTVPAYLAADWNDGKVPAAMLALPIEQRFLVELLAINMREEHFSGSDIDPQKVSVGQGRNGAAGVNYAVVNDQRRAYQQLTERYVGKCLTILLDGQVLSAPILNGPISGVGIIEALPPQAVDDLVKVLRNQLPLPLEFVR